MTLKMHENNAHRIHAILLRGCIRLSSGPLTAMAALTDIILPAVAQLGRMSAQFQLLPPPGLARMFPCPQLPAVELAVCPQALAWALPALSSHLHSHRHWSRSSLHIETGLLFWQRTYATVVLLATASSQQWSDGVKPQPVFRLQLPPSPSGRSLCQQPPAVDSARPQALALALSELLSHLQIQKEMLGATVHCSLCLGDCRIVRTVVHPVRAFCCNHKPRQA